MRTPWDVFTAVSDRRLSIPEAMARYRMSYARLLVAMFDAGHLMPAALVDCRRSVADFAEGRLSRAEAIAKSGLRDYAGLLVTLGERGLEPPRPSPEVVEEQAATFERVWRAA